MILLEPVGLVKCHSLDGATAATHGHYLALSKAWHSCRGFLFVFTDGYSDEKHSEAHDDSPSSRVSDDNEAASQSDSSAASSSVSSSDNNQQQQSTSGRLDVDHMYSDHESQDGHTRSRTTVIRDIVKVITLPRTQCYFHNTIWMSTEMLVFWAWELELQADRRRGSWRCKLCSVARTLSISLT